MSLYIQVPEDDLEREKKRSFTCLKTVLSVVGVVVVVACIHVVWTFAAFDNLQTRTEFDEAVKDQSHCVEQVLKKKVSSECVKVLRWTSKGYMWLLAERVLEEYQLRASAMVPNAFWTFQLQKSVDFVISFVTGFGWIVGFLAVLFLAQYLFTRSVIAQQLKSMTPTPVTSSRDARSMRFLYPPLSTPKSKRRKYHKQSNNEYDISMPMEIVDLQEYDEP